MITPRPYISFSQMALFERSPELYVQRYIYDRELPVSRNMEYGKMMAEGLEYGEATGDPILDLMMAKLPKFNLMDQPVIAKKGMGAFINFSRGGGFNVVYVPLLKDKGGDIPILALPDTTNEDYSAFKEYKTSTRKWTQRMADDSSQITFYAIAIWLRTAHIPRDIELVNITVKYDQKGDLVPTGELVRLSTTRSMVDVIRMCARIRKNWHGIKKLCESELL